MRPPYFPVRVADLLGDVTLPESDDGRRSRSAGPRSASRGAPRRATPTATASRSTACVDRLHQRPPAAGRRLPHRGARRCSSCADGADLLIHDAQYTPDEFALKATWGHCTVDYAVRVAAEAGVRRLALFHHDPSHDDATIDALAAHARSLAADTPVEEVLIATEGLTVVLAGGASCERSGRRRGAPTHACRPLTIPDASSDAGSRTQ